MRATVLVLLVLGVAVMVAPAHAGVSPFWRELGGSATGDGLSQTPAPRAILDTSVAVDAAGQPVVAYAELPTATDTQGPIVVKRWNGTAFDTLGTIGGPGYLPQVRISASGTIVVAWLQDDADGNREIRLRIFDGASFVELGGSDSAGGISGTTPGITFPFSLAVGIDGQPVVAFLANAQTGIGEVTPSPAVVHDTPQVYVRRWSGTAWEFVGSNFTGGGASNAVSFGSPTAGSVLHAADTPSLAIDSSGAPVVAFVYVTQLPGGVVNNRDVYVKRWSGTAWQAVGPALPSTDGVPGRGGAGGVSASNTASLNPAIAAGPEGTLALAWEEVSPDDTALSVWVRVWNGAAWVELDGSARNSGISEPFTLNSVPQIAIGSDRRPIVAWSATTAGSPAAQIFVKRSNGTTWIEPAFHSATNAGISDATLEALAPALALTPSGGTATPGVPTVAWIDARAAGAPAQVFLRQLFSGPTFPLSVRVAGAGEVTTDPIGMECGGGVCPAEFPSGTTVTLVPTPRPPARFLGWTGECAGSGPCLVDMTAPRSLNASFSVALGVTVPAPGGGRVSSTPAGITNCIDSCAMEFAPGAVTLTATAEAGGAFAGWGGACAWRGANPTCTLTLATANTNVVASFKHFTVRVAVGTPAGTTGQGMIGTVAGGDLDCGADGIGTCSVDLMQGTRVVLQATPQPANRFLTWSTGPCAGRTNSTCEFTVAGNTTSTALFRGVTGVRVLKAGNGSGTVSGTGISCGADCFEELFSGTTATLTPTATTGTTFRGWAGDACHGKTTGACTFVVAGNRSTTVANQSITASFQLNVLKLAVTQRSNGTVVSDPLPGGGLDCGTSTNVCQGLYDFNTRVILRATADPGAVFAGWAGVACLFGGASNRSCEFKLMANTTATPTFRPRTQVTVTKPGNGAGTVSGPGISCGATCSAPEFDGRLVTLTVAPLTGSRFAGWGDACAFRGMNTSCAFSPTGDTQSVTAAFELIPYTLTVTSRASGTVVNLDALPDPIDCGSGGVGKCSATVNFGTPVRLQARPIAGSKFTSWTGCTSVVGANCSFTMTANRTVTPAYRDISSVSLTKTGMGTVTSAPAGISCGTMCASAAFDFARNALVKLTPAPVTGWDFTGWRGDGTCAGTGTCSFNASTLGVAVAADFTIQLKTLRVTVIGSGSVTGLGAACDGTSTPCTQLFPYNSLPVLTPVAAPGFRFTGWSQDCTGLATCRPTMTANHSVTATFKQVFGVTVTRQGNAAPGTITATGISCGLDCAEDYLSNTVVTFSRGAPPAGRTFRWLGDCAFRGTNASCALTVDANKSVIADYSLQQLGLTINIAGPGSVTGLADGPCASSGGNANCMSVVDYGTAILLQAVPRPASPQGEFVKWAGCTTALGANCSVPMTSNRTVVATFQPVVTGLTVQAADSAVPLVKGGRRQYSAIATFDDGSVQDVSARSTWVSSNTSVASVVSTTGLVTGAGFGTSTLTAVFRTSPTGSMAQGSIDVAGDTLAANGLTVDCSPYGDDGGPVSCLPAGVGFEVECRAFATLAHGGATQDVTQQAAWSSGNAGSARFLGLSDFGGPVLASFRVLTGTTFVRATIGSVASSNNSSPVNRWVVQSTPLSVSNVSVAPASLAFTDATPAALIATAQFNTVTSPAAGCPVAPATPPERDFSALTGWATVPQPSPVAEADFFGVVTPLATGSTSVGWKYPRGAAAPAFQGSIPISVTLP